MRRVRLPLLFLSFALLASCGDEPPIPATIVNLVGDDGSIGSGPIAPGAVDEVQLVLVPDPADGRFPPQEQRVFDEGVESRISSAGEWVLTLGSAYVEANVLAAETFRMDVPLYAEEEMDGATQMPTLRVIFFQGGERIAESNPRFVPWPLQPGTSIPVTVLCGTGSETACSGG
ncbi:MAG TPA: hypothetical protein RMH85_03810 [Polyangiaceae bacterium LLY-WYZ-15_(1-7)]|nr:hypothetical protein [Sandaracinus sp.]HJL03857.1 hypothetical protein [Polyangiaceae bacterium LLY-WYZ-15_(1-7)]MBJ73290.1 hypothetical protein [Sandaracinus sp.]HJL07593.1 hypothetical protein [Polyangiaceae bacterium LLY-WYZ-15_(1-7)]HJL24360.1 hypothetical protein [Polyangiaceae bacterium LLY-WYZ-15_(1-7)]